MVSCVEESVTVNLDGVRMYFCVHEVVTESPLTTEFYCEKPELCIAIRIELNSLVAFPIPIEPKLLESLGKSLLEFVVLVIVGNLSFDFEAKDLAPCLVSIPKLCRVQIALDREVSRASVTIVPRIAHDQCYGVHETSY